MLKDRKADQFFNLFMSEQKRIYTFILTLLPNQFDADDVMQETAIILWNKFDEFDPNTNFLAWALTIAKFQVMGFCKTISRDKLQFNGQMIDRIAEKVTQRHSTFETRRQTLKKCIGKLNPEDRHLILLRYEKGLTIKEVAKQVQRPIHGMYKAMSRIHEALLNCVNLNVKIETVHHD